MSIEPPPSQTKGGPVCLILINISKYRNVQSLLMTAAAFGVDHVLIVGQRHLNFDANSPRSNNIPNPIKEFARVGRIHFTRFEKWRELVAYLRDHKIRLVGVEIHPKAVNIEEYRPITERIAFLMGNEGQGIHEKHMADCDDFVIVSQYGGGTASLNVNVACSIILHRYHDYRRQRRHQTIAK